MGNFKMRCVDKGGGDMYTNGKVYEYKDGRIVSDNGTMNMIFDTFKEFQELSMAEWELITENQISTKEELEDGDICVLRNSERIVFFEEYFFMKDGKSVNIAYGYNSELVSFCSDKYDIMEVYRNKELIYKREEKSAQQIEIENIQTEMGKLNKRLEVLKGEM